ncbi:hypothetical protein KSK37_00515 [Kaistella sp. DKR-2]|uniref:hypothetical protein n=1 Tax=Kaistella soli TaxID=2849654 RepID=UPI001C27550A|nr:hypothetical protein [Kaistella soli]MBU8881558.1 hypothetical protein [Kaistella soli]
MTFKSILKRRFFGPETGLSFIHYGGENPFFSWLKDGKTMGSGQLEPKLKEKKSLQVSQEYILFH